MWPISRCSAGDSTLDHSFDDLFLCPNVGDRQFDGSAITNFVLRHLTRVIDRDYQVELTFVHHSDVARDLQNGE